jgi:indole-3-acetate monooxygenase
MTVADRTDRSDSSDRTDRSDSSDRTDRSAADVLRAVEDLAPTIAERAPQIEAARRVPPDLLDELVRAGCFELLLPRSHGGLGADLPAAMRVLETLAAADASVAWTVGIGAGAWLDLVGLPRPTFDAVMTAAPHVIIAGVFRPSGTATPVDGGYRVSGRWGFASGCEHATWLYGNCVVAGTGHDGGPPSMRIVVLDPEEVTIEDTWHTSGLAGTGSHHFRVDDVFVPVERTVEPMGGVPAVDEPIVRVPLLTVLSLGLASIALGVAGGAVDDVVGLAAGKVPMLASSTLGANPLFRYELATADTEVRAARALAHELAGAAWADAVHGTEPTLAGRARARAAGAWITARAAAVVDTAYRSGGGTALYSDHPLQRRLRDVHAITQHFLVKPDTLTEAGAVLVGDQPGVPVF